MRLCGRSVRQRRIGGNGPPGVRRTINGRGPGASGGRGGVARQKSGGGLQVEEGEQVRLHPRRGRREADLLPLGRGARGEPRDFVRWLGGLLSGGRRLPHREENRPQPQRAAQGHNFFREHVRPLHRDGYTSSHGASEPKRGRRPRAVCAMEPFHGARRTTGRGVARGCGGGRAGQGGSPLRTALHR